MPLLETLGAKAATVIISKIATEVLKGIGDRLSPTELSKAIHAAINAADQQVDLFGPAEQGVIPDFLELFAKRSTQELQKPLKDEGIPDVAFLVKVFEALLEEKPKVEERLPDKSKKAIAPWLAVFVNTYFEKTNQVRFQVAKEDYLEQLANFFDDVKFTGVTVDNQEIDKAKRLAQIFVMPDVQEDVRDR
jgi:anion-transporting  ArsA/GET3 family ATPase